MTADCLAYVAQGRIHRIGDGSSRELESRFGLSLRDRAAQIHNRHAWKMQGTSAQFMRGMLWDGMEAKARDFRVAMTSVTRGRAPGELLYSLETDEISGVFAVNAEGEEQRLFHTADFRIRHLAMHPDGSAIAGSVCYSHLLANLAVMNADGSNLHDISEGDSLDLAPRWVPGSGNRLVFQSAGVGRDAAGRLAGTSPFAVQELNLDSAEISTLAEDPEADLLGPQKSADGALYYIRRPRLNRRPAADPFGILKDTVLFPFRLSFAVFQFFNFFSMRYTGRPLSTSKGAAQRLPDLRRMMVWGNLIDVDQAAREDRSGDPDAPSLVPQSWQLVRQTEAGKEVLAKGVLSFDFSNDGALLYSNGSSIHRIDPATGRPERVLVGTMIEQIAAM